MAIYHFTVKTISRSKGQSAVRCAAYRRATKLFDERTQKNENYLNKSGVVFSKLLIPESAPAWLKEIANLENKQKHRGAEMLWNQVEQREKMETSQVAREIEFALPIELNQEQCIVLAREYITDQFIIRGMIADWSVHWDEGNPHVHVMLTMREITETGFGNKQRQWNNKQLLQEWREQWAQYVNFHLKMHNYDIRIDHRPYQEQGIDLIPTLHQGKAVTDMESRGITTDIMREANVIREQNLHKIAQNPDILFKKIHAQQDNFSEQKVIQELGRYISDKGIYDVY